MTPPADPPKHSSSRLASRALRLGALATVAAVVVGIGGGWFVSRRAPTAALDRLVGECEIEMLRGTCRVQTGAVSPLDSAVFVAGVGRIDAASYQRLRDAGQALCSSVRDTCRGDWNGAGCRAARALHGQP